MAENAKVILRKASKDDLGAICDIENASFSNPWSRESFLGAMSDEHTLVIAAERAGEQSEIAGYAIVWSFMDEAEIMSIAVSPTHRRCGIGRVMMEHALCTVKNRGAETVFLEVRQSNEGAKAMYASFGFDPVGVRKKYYSLPTEDAIVMRLDMHRES